MEVSSVERGDKPGCNTGSSPRRVAAVLPDDLQALAGHPDNNAVDFLVFILGHDHHVGPLPVVLVNSDRLSSCGNPALDHAAGVRCAVEGQLAAAADRGFQRRAEVAIAETVPTSAARDRAGAARRGGTGRSSTHRYVFTLFAVKQDALPVNADTSAAIVGFQLHFNTIEKATLTGKVQR